jgi:hypothetical protein
LSRRRQLLLQTAAVPNHEDVLVRRPVYVPRPELTVDDDGLGLLVMFEVGDAFDERVGCETSRPDDHAVRNLALLLDVDVAFMDGGDMVLGLDVDPFAVVLLRRVLRERLVEGRQYCLADVVDADACERTKSWVGAVKISTDKIVKFSSEFDACRPSTHNHEVQQSLPLDVRDRRLRRKLVALKDPLADIGGVSNVLQKVRMLLDAGRTKRLRVGTDGDDELVVL